MTLYWDHVHGADLPRPPIPEGYTVFYNDAVSEYELLDSKKSVALAAINPDEFYTMIRQEWPTQSERRLRTLRGIHEVGFRDDGYFYFPEEDEAAGEAHKLEDIERFLTLGDQGMGVLFFYFSETWEELRKLIKTRPYLEYPEVVVSCYDLDAGEQIEYEVETVVTFPDEPT
jgi:hypothetical protein